MMLQCGKGDCCNFWLLILQSSLKCFHLRPAFCSFNKKDEDDMRQIPLHLNSLLKHTSHMFASFACHRGPFLSV